MVATRALRAIEIGEDGDAMRRCLRDVVALSSLPVIWLRAEPRQIADSLAQLMVSVLDAEFASVVLPHFGIEAVQTHNRTTDPAAIRAELRPDWIAANVQFDFEHPAAGRLNGYSVPIGRASGAILTALCKRNDFPTESDRLLLQVAASQAAVTIERWQTEQSLRAEVHQREQLQYQQTSLLREQAALYRFTDTLYRTPDTAQIFEAALDAILSALHCSRASVLLYDADAVMRFVAWRDLSPQYRKAVEGHSPWTPDTADPQPICIDSIDHADIEQGLKATVKAEGIEALSFVPLVANGRLIGKFMTYYDTPHKFGDRDIEIALTIARQLAFAIEQDRLRSDRRAAERALRESEARKTAILESALDAIVALDSEGRILDFNPAAERLFGYRRSNVLGNFLSDLIIPASLRDDHRRELERHLRTGQSSIVGQRTEMPALRADGSEIQTEFTVAPSTGEDPGVRFIACIRDITEQKRAEAQRELLIAELNHRVKNTLATVIALGHQSFAHGRSPEAAWRSFDERVRALAQTHTRLAEACWSSVSLEALIWDELTPYRPSGNRITVAGPHLGLGVKRAIAIGMAIHELVTNAAKYGALSTSTGAVSVSWKIQDNKAELKWVESGGPPVEPPTRSGFGQLLLQRALASDLQGKVDLSFERDGVQCSISFALENAKTTEPQQLADSAGPASKSAIRPGNGDATAQPTVKANGNQPAKRSAQSARLLLVEDEFLLAIDLQNKLIEEGYVVVGPYHNLAEALAASALETIDLAVLDTNLNGEFVFPLADKLIERNIPCVFLTGYGASNLPAKFRSLPIVTKPSHPDAVLAQIRALLNSSREAWPILGIQEHRPTVAP